MRRTLSKFMGFRRAESGAAYLEFALCAPVLMLLLMGGIEMTRFILITQKVEKVAVTLSDVVSQGSTISTTDLNNMITAATQVMLPYVFGANGYVVISSVTQTGAYSGSNPPKVSWQYTGGGSWTQTSRVGSVGNTATLPGGFTLNDKDNIIIAEVFYHYTPMITPNGVIGSQSLYQVGIYKPRLGSLSTLSALPFWLMEKGALL